MQFSSQRDREVHCFEVMNVGTEKNIDYLIKHTIIEAVFLLYGDTEMKSQNFNSNLLLS